MSIHVENISVHDQRCPGYPNIEQKTLNAHKPKWVSPAGLNGCSQVPPSSATWPIYGLGRWSKWGRLVEPFRIPFAWLETTVFLCYIRSEWPYRDWKIPGSFCASGFAKMIEGPFQNFNILCFCWPKVSCAAKISFILSKDVERLVMGLRKTTSGLFPPTPP